MCFCRVNLVKWFDIECKRSSEGGISGVEYLLSSKSIGMEEVSFDVG